MHFLGKILLVENNVSICSVYASILKDEGYFLKYTNTGKGAMELLENNAFDIAICDFYLPDINGISLAKKIKERDENIYSILFTAASSDKIEIEALASGINDFILKPCGDGRLLLGIQRGIEIRKDRIYRKLIGNKVTELSHLVEEYGYGGK